MGKYNEIALQRAQRNRDNSEHPDYWNHDDPTLEEEVELEIYEFAQSP